MRRFAGPPQPLRPIIEVPESVEKAIFRALDKDSANRFATVGEFLDALEGKATAPSAAAPPPSAPASKPAPAPAPTPAQATPAASSKKGCLSVLVGWIAIGMMVGGKR